VVDAQGRLVQAWGDIDRPVFPRSAVKLIQALPLVTSGAADAFGLSEAQLALACASHGGEPEHVATAAAMLAQAGLDEAALECGSHWPSFAEATHALARKAVHLVPCTTTARASTPASSAWAACWPASRAGTRGTSCTAMCSPDTR
jgi:L-asparaginase II